MGENGQINDSTSKTTIWFLFIILVALLILLFFLYKYLNQEANGKYTVQRIVFREGGLRDRARRAALGLGNRLGVQLWPQSDTDPDEEDMEDEEEASSNENESSDEDDEIVHVNEQKNESMAEDKSAKGSCSDNSVDSLNEDRQAEAELAPESKAEGMKTMEATEDDVQDNKAGEANTPIVISLNHFSGSVLWSEEDKCDGDVTAL